MNKKNKECQCIYCGKVFYAVDKKASICPSCKVARAICPDCGGHKGIRSIYCQRCSKQHTHKGKTYQEIYGKKEIKCGFQKGENNVAKKSEVRKKISKGVKNSYDEILREKRRILFNKYRHVNYSKISQELFWDIYIRLENKSHIYFAELNKEFQKTDNINHKGYYYDFTDTINKKIIEYNGDKFHGNPSIYESTDKPSPYSDETSEEIWQKDKQKIKVMEDLGYNILIIWDSDYKKDKKEALKKCLDFLKG